MRIKIFSAACAAVLATGLCGCAGAPTRGPLGEAERLYLARCTSCHGAASPGERTAGDWERAVARMEQLKKVTLTPDERRTLLGWLAEGAQPDGSTALAAGGAPAAR